MPTPLRGIMVTGISGGGSGALERGREGGGGVGVGAGNPVVRIKICFQYEESYDDNTVVPYLW